MQNHTPPNNETKQRLYAIDVKKNEMEALLVGLPLFKSGDFFQKIFSYTVGFRWLIRLSYNITPYIETPSLPITYYYFNWASTRNNANEEVIYTYRFSTVEHSYRVNLINFLAVPLDYIASNLGSIIGYAIVAPFTIPAYLAINFYYGCEKLYVKSHYKNDTSQAPTDTEKYAPASDPLESPPAPRGKRKVVINFSLPGSAPTIDAESLTPPSF